MKASQFEELSPPTGAIVFIGDSITEGGDWHECFPEHSVVNRGISADTSAGVLKRVAVAVRNSPSTVFLLIGTNDITSGRKDAEILADVRAIVGTIQAQAPGAHVVLQSIMPRQAKYRGRIEGLNAHYRQIAAAMTNVEYVDLWPVLADGDALRTAFTLDGLHLNGPAYRVWTDLLRRLLPAAKR